MMLMLSVVAFVYGKKHDCTIYEQKPSKTLNEINKLVCEKRVCIRISSDSTTQPRAGLH